MTSENAIISRHFSEMGLGVQTSIGHGWVSNMPERFRLLEDAGREFHHIVRLSPISPAEFAELNRQEKALEQASREGRYSKEQSRAYDAYYKNLKSKGFETGLLGDKRIYDCEFVYTSKASGQTVFKALDGREIPVVESCVYRYDNWAYRAFHCKTAEDTVALTVAYEAWLKKPVSEWSRFDKKSDRVKAQLISEHQGVTAPTIHTEHFHVDKQLLVKFFSKEQRAALVKEVKAIFAGAVKGKDASDVFAAYAKDKGAVMSDEVAETLISLAVAQAAVQMSAKEPDFYATYVQAPQVIEQIRKRVAPANNSGVA